MKKTVQLAMGFILSGLLVAAVHAGPNDGSGTPQTEGLGSAQSGTSVQTAPPKSGLSKRNKAVIEQSKSAEMRRDKIQSSATGTVPKKSGLSKRNKAVIEQSKASKMKRDKLQSSNTGTMPK